MSFSKTLYPLLSTGSTQEDRIHPAMTEKLLTGTESINTIKTIGMTVQCYQQVYVLTWFLPRSFYKIYFKHLNKLTKSCNTIILDMNSIYRRYMLV